MKTRPTIIAFGMHGIWHRCEQPEHFEKLIRHGFRLVRPSGHQQWVEACVMSGIPAKAFEAGVYDWPERPSTNEVNQ